MRLYALYGPTAAGKTAMAVQLRQRGLPVVALSCDALQVYRGLDAATAKPTAAERAAIPYHLLDLIGPEQPMTAGQWVAAAESAAAAALAAGQWPLLVGGTGLYLRALGQGLAAIPAVPAEVRAMLALQWQQDGGPEQLYAELQRVDPDYAAKTPPQNRQRVLRALEVWRHTGRAFSDYHREHAAAPPRHQVRLCALLPLAADHAAQVANRASAMAEPLWHEVAALRAAGLPTAAPGLQALGYRDAVALQEASVPPQVGVTKLAEQLLQAHRAYIKRQLTWLGREDVHLRLDPTAPGALDLLAADVAGWFAAR
jgi:tRNA dimethylallyltransferase